MRFFAQPSNNRTIGRFVAVCRTSTPGEPGQDDHAYPETKEEQQEQHVPASPIHCDALRIRKSRQSGRPVTVIQLMHLNKEAGASLYATMRCVLISSTYSGLTCR